MFETMPNDRTVNVKVTRGDLCRLLIILTAAGEGETWKKLHDKLKTQLEEFDRKQEGNND